jgi:hypothetical protein
MMNGKPVYEKNVAVFENSRYVVHVRIEDEELGTDGPLHLSIRDHGRTARHDWREFQRIKNDLVGDEREALEIYPRNSRIVDTSNQFHLWVMPAGFDIPLGWDAGKPVMFDADEEIPEELLRQAAGQMGLDPDEVVAGIGNAKQRKLEEKAEEEECPHCGRNEWSDVAEEWGGHQPGTEQCQHCNHVRAVA